ncbi:hypothetical protein [Halorientalis marina]|jgi:hypothetical protein|uniref:hypothetical protein n=1 Tax=Halorientalis marina TaxID=2931976 RepID=UPI001FF436F8|nr:hypothetical protein [Halorientalis marina]
MNMDISDRRELLGLVVGVFLVLVGLGTVVGQPWARVSNVGVAGVQILGALVAIGIGVLLVLLSRDDELPF